MSGQLKILLLDIYGAEIKFRSNLAFSGVLLLFLWKVKSEKIEKTKKTANTLEKKGNHLINRYL